MAQKVIFGRGMVASSAMADAVRQVKAAGYRTALLTNISRDGDKMWRGLIPVDELFDVVIEDWFAEIGKNMLEPLAGTEAPRPNPEHG